MLKTSKTQKWRRLPQNPTKSNIDPSVYKYRRKSRRTITDDTATVSATAAWPWNRLRNGSIENIRLSRMRRKWWYRDTSITTYTSIITITTIITTTKPRQPHHQRCRNLQILSNCCVQWIGTVQDGCWRKTAASWSRERRVKKRVMSFSIFQ